MPVSALKDYYAIEENTPIWLDTKTMMDQSTAKKPKITVYIACHNYGQYLERAIESVLRQTMDDWELLIINDNSTDNTSDIMKLYEGAPRIRLFHTEGLGLPGVCNLAIKEARGERLIRLDGDDIFDENILLVLSNYLDRNPNCSMVFPDYYLMDQQGNVFSQERREKIHGNNHLLDVPANGACFLIKKEVLENLNGYREDLGAQDGFDLWTRLMADYKVANINLPLFYYRRHGKNLTENSQHIIDARRRIKFDAIEETLKKHRPIIAYIPCRVHYDFSSNLWKRSLREKSLLEHCIDKCVNSPLFDHIIVGADTLQVKTVMQKFNDPRLSFAGRHPEDTMRSASLTQSLERIIQELDPEYQGTTVISYLQAPFVKTETLEEAVATLLLNDVSSSM
nr:glycosyltransferase family 2 protein [Desulfobulbaceae bacterium]